MKTEDALLLAQRELEKALNRLETTRKILKDALDAVGEAKKNQKAPSRRFQRKRRTHK